MADIWQVQDAFWNSFGIPAYDDQTAEPDIGYPHITYESLDGVLGDERSLSINLWYRSSSWAEIKQKATEIRQSVQDMRPIPFDRGYLWIKLPTSGIFSQPFGSGSDDSEIKRMLLTVEAEALAF